MKEKAATDFRGGFAMLQRVKRLHPAKFAATTSQFTTFQNAAM